jgi:alpha-glucosidase
MQPIKSHTGEVTYTLIFHIYTGDSSTFNFYEDDGVSYDHQHGGYALRKIIQDHQNKSILISSVEGTYQSTAKRIRLVFHGLDANAQHIHINGTELPLARDLNISFVALEKFDPIHDPDPAPQQNVHTVDFDYVRDEILVRF